MPSDDGVSDQTALCMYKELSYHMYLLQYILSYIGPVTPLEYIAVPARNCGLGARLPLDVAVWERIHAEKGA